MTDHNLSKILSSFSKQEIKEFEKFIWSPIYNGGRNYAALFTELKKFYPDFTGRNYTKEKLYNNLYPGRAYNKNIIDTALSRLMKMAEDYLSYISYKRKNATMKYELIHELLNRNLNSLAEKKLNEYSKLVEASVGINDDLIKSKMDYEILKVQLSFRSDKSQEASDSSLKQTDYHLRFSLMRLAQFIHNLRTNKMMFNVEFDKTFTAKYLAGVNLKGIYAALKDSSENEELNEITLIYVLWILGLTDSKNEKHFFEMKELVLKNIELFHHHEKYNLFQALEAIAWVMEGEIDRERFEIELFRIHKKRLEHNVLMPDNKYMRIILYRAILVTLFYEPELDYIQNFISKCIPLLPPDHRENMYNFSMAQLNYFIKDFGKALEFNNKLNFDMFAFKYDTRLLQFRIYYELNYSEEAYSLVDAHRHFITSNKTVSAYYKELHTNFLSYYTKLLRLKNEHTQEETEILKREISASNNLISKHWFLEKVQEIGMK